MKRLICFLVVCIMSTSCATTYYQVFSVKSENVPITQEGSPFYVKDGLEFTYNFWGEYGKLRFIIYNSNDYDVIVDMTKSFFIRNNIAEDYYRGKQIETRVATGVYRMSKYGAQINVDKRGYVGGTLNYLGNSYDSILALGASAASTEEYGTAVKKEWHTAVTIAEPEQVRIPAKSAKFFMVFDINNVLVTGSEFIVGYGYNPVTFTKNNTPMDMRNRICVYREGEAPLYYDMDFYISEIGNVASLDNMADPTSFYISYSSRLEGKFDYGVNFTQHSQPQNVGTTDESDTAKSTPSETIAVGEIISYKSHDVIVCGISEEYVAIVKLDDTKCSWNEAIEYCKSLGNEWQLPTKNVLDIIDSFGPKRVKGYSNNFAYWTEEEVDEKRAKFYDPIYDTTYKANKSNNYGVLPCAVIKRSDLK